MLQVVYVNIAFLYESVIKISTKLHLYSALPSAIPAVVCFNIRMPEWNDGFCGADAPAQPFESKKTVLNRRGVRTVFIIIHIVIRVDAHP